MVLGVPVGWLVCGSDEGVAVGVSSLEVEYTGVFGFASRREPLIRRGGGFGDAKGLRGTVLGRSPSWFGELETLPPRRT